MECGKGRRKGLLLSRFILAWFFLSDYIVAARDRERYDTAYECEGKQLRIECGEGEVIHLIRANYGRFSITICNEHGNTDWSVNCMSQKSFRVLFNKCNDQRNCSITASTSHFGDPCPSTLKYLEAHYQCVSAATTAITTRPSPRWLITSQPSVWGPSTPTVRPPPRPTIPPSQMPAITTLSTPVITTSLSSTSTMKTVPVNENEEQVETNPSKGNESPVQPVVPMTTETTTEAGYASWKTSKKPIASTSIPYVDQNINNNKWYDYNRQYCPPVMARNLYWNATRTGDIAVQSCPGGANGLARWRCAAIDDTPVWYRESPDLSECRSVWLTSLETRVIEGGTILSIASDLSLVTNNSRTLYGGDMMITTKIIKNMAEKMGQDIRTYQDTRQKEVSVTELLQGVVRTGSNLLDKAQMASWKDLSHQEQMRVATSLLIGLEENAFLLADSLNHQKTIIQEGKNILMEVRVLEARNIDTNYEAFPAEENRERWTASNDHVELSRRSLLENSDGGLVRLVFMAFDRLEEILQPQIEEESFVAINEDIKSRNISNRILNSKVISASLGKGRHIQMSEPVRIYFQHLTSENVTNPTCVFWDYIMSAWSEEGCQTRKTNSTHTICECNHLTNFAVLMDVHAVKLDMAHQIALQIITYIGCIISIVCLVLAILTFQLFRGLKSDRTTIHKNLCICLLIAELLFVCGIGQTDQRVVCGVVAGLLHFFFLCAFAWMFLEGFQLYVMLIEVFEAEKSRLRWYYLVAYGGPLLVVGISCIIDPFSYGTDRYCWLRADNYFIFSFVGPVIVVILANLVFLSMAIYMMCRHANTTVTMKSKEHSRLASARAWLRGAIVLVFLLGLTWTFGLLYLNQESVIMAYIFCVLNSLQGLFIFVFHCVQNEKVRKEYRKFIRRHSWLPKCLRCSKTVTGSSSGSTGTSGGQQGVNGGKDYPSHNTSSNPSAPTTDSSGLSPHAASNNISFKSYSRDSGHGGSEQEDSPRIQNTMTLGHSVRGRERGRQLCDGLEINSNRQSRRAASPYNHTYTEIRDGIGGVNVGIGRLGGGGGGGYHPSHLVSRSIIGGGGGDDDPVYEEIERGGNSVIGNCGGVIGGGVGNNNGGIGCLNINGIGEIQVSDMSDEDGRRQSDMSRQSSRSYGDHRPLIPYSPANDRLIQYGQSIDRNLLQQYNDLQYNVTGGDRVINNYWDNKLKRQQTPKHEHGDNINNRIQNNYGLSQQQDHTRTVAVLDGHTVVCHLQPQTDMYTGRGVPPPSYSEC